MVGNAYLAVVTVIALFCFSYFAQTAECEKKVCFGSASEKCETAWSPYVSGALKQNSRRGQHRQKQ